MSKQAVEMSVVLPFLSSVMSSEGGRRLQLP
jgi:hypothetical protein